MEETSVLQKQTVVSTEFWIFPFDNFDLFAILES